MKVRIGSSYTKPLVAVHWGPKHNRPPCGQYGALVCDESPLRITCRSCRRRIRTAFSINGLMVQILWLEAAWLGDAEGLKKYADWEARAVDTWRELNQPERIEA